MVTSEGPTNQWKKGTVNAALNSAAHFVGGNNFLNCKSNKSKIYNSHYLIPNDIYLHPDIDFNHLA